MYVFYLGELQLPVAPSKMETKINNQNKTINLINDGEINLLKTPGLTEFSFEFMIPQTRYPFASYPYGFLKAEYFLAELESMKTSLKPVGFTVFRKREHPIVSQNGIWAEYNELFDTSLRVTVEDYTVTDSTEEGFDLMVSITLKQYRPYSTKTVTLKELENGSTVANLNEKRDDYSAVTLPTYYEAKKGDTFWSISKKFYGVAAYYQKIYDANKDRLGLVTTSYVPYNSQINFDAAVYASENPDVVAVMGNDAEKLYEHYLVNGKKEGRKASLYSSTVDYKYYIPAL